MTWDDNKSEFNPRNAVPNDSKISAEEWNAMVADQKDHGGRHENGASDEINVDGLAGVLADPQTPETEAVQDIVSNLLSGGSNVSLSYDDGNDVLTLDTSALAEEEVEDAVAALVTAGNAITVNYDDTNDSLSIGVNESSLSFYDGTNLTADVDNQSVSTGDLDIENANFVSEGDRFIIAVTTFTESFSTTSSNFQPSSATGNQGYVDLSVVPSDVTLQARFIGETGGTMETDGDYRAVIRGREGSPNETTPIATVAAGNTFTPFVTAAEELSLRELITPRPSIRSDGTNTVDMYNSAVQFEVVL